MKGSKIAMLSVLTAVSLIIFLLENLLVPIVPITPYVKLGLSNCIILYVLYTYGAKDSFIVLIVKILLGSLISGNWYAFAFNIAGGFSSLFVMAMIKYYLGNKVSLISISVCGAVISNIVRTAVGVIIMQTIGLFFTLYVAVIISVFAGIISGTLAIFIKNKSWRHSF